MRKGLSYSLKPRSSHILAWTAAVLLLLGAGCARRARGPLAPALPAVELGARPAAGMAQPHLGPDQPESPSLALPPPTVLDDAPVTGEITIQKDCLLQIRVKEDPSLNGSYPVNTIGAVQLGYVGPVILFNKSERQAERKIKQILESRGEFKVATVDVRILRASYDKVRVAGAVGSPGLVRIGAGDTISLNDALLRVGGLSASIRGAKVKIVRGGLLSAVAPALRGETYSLVSEGGAPRVPDVVLKNNDVAYVSAPEAERRLGAAAKTVLVLGEVRREGYYSFSGAERASLMNLVFKMGGLPPFANDKAIRIIRRDLDGNEEELEANVRRVLKEGNPDLDMMLENGDRIIVPARRLTFF